MAEGGTAVGEGARDDDAAAIVIDGEAVTPGSHRVFAVGAAEMSGIVDALTIAHRPDRGRFFVDGVDLADAELGEPLVDHRPETPRP